MGNTIMRKLVLDLTEENYVKLMELLKNRSAVELVTRNAEAQFQPFVNATVSDFADEVKAEAAKMINKESRVNRKMINQLTQVVSKQNVAIDQLFRGVSDNAKLIQDLSANVDTLTKGMQVLSKVSWISLGLNVFNLGVSFVGFEVLNRKVNALESQIVAIEQRVSGMEKRLSSVEQQNVQFLIREGSYLIDDIKAEAEKMELGQGCWPDVKKVLDKCWRFMSFLISDAEKTDKEGSNKENDYEIIYRFLPVYADIISIAYQNYYEQMVERYTDNPNNWSSIFDQLMSEKYRSSMYDYYFLQRRMHNKETREVLDANFLLVLKSRCEIESTIEKMEIAGSKEYYDLLQTLENDQIVKEAEDLLPALEQEYSEEEALSILQQSLLENYGIKTRLAA